MRAYADREYQAHVPEWSERIGQQVQTASAITEATFGVRLEVESVRAWERPPDTGDLVRALDLLTREDPAFEVDWVVGFTGPSPRSDSDVELIGRAAPFGRHFVVRAMDSAAKTEWVELSFAALSPEERAGIARRRIAHMEVSTFLHEWAHTLGAVHECADKWIMSKRHTVMASAFSPESARLVSLGLEHRDRRGASSRLEWTRAYGDAARRMSSAWWDCETLERALGVAQRLLALSSRTSLSSGDRTPVTASEHWLDAIAPSLTRRQNDIVARLRLLVARQEATDRITVVSVSLDRSGLVSDVAVLLSSGFAPLDEAVVEAARAQTYPSPPPELLDGSGRCGFTWSFRAEL